jgi:hypothetical protein
VYLELHKGSLKPFPALKELPRLVATNLALNKSKKRQSLTTVIPATNKSKKANDEKATRAASDHALAELPN